MYTNDMKIFSFIKISSIKTYGKEVLQKETRLYRINHS